MFVVGESMSKGTFIRNSAIVATIAEGHGLSLVLRRSRSLRRRRCRGVKWVVPLVPMIYETTSLLRLVLGRGGFDG